MTSIINRLQLIVAIKFDNQFICHSQYCLIQLILITVPVNHVWETTQFYIFIKDLSILVCTRIYLLYA